MTDSIEQRGKDIKEARNKLSQLQICKMKYIYEYTCEFRKWYYDTFDSNMNMTILANTYYEKLLGKLSNYFKEEYEKIKPENADTLGARIEFLKKRLTKLCTQRYVVKGAKYGEKLFCDQIDNILGNCGYKEYRKRKFKRQLGKPIIKYKKFRKEWRKSFKKYYKKKFNYKRKNVTENTSKDKSRCKCWKCGELGHYNNECQKEKKTFILWGENEEEDLESILSFDSEMSSVYSENDNSSSESDIE